MQHPTLVEKGLFSLCSGTLHFGSLKECLLSVLKAQFMLLSPACIASVQVIFYEVSVHFSSKSKWCPYILHMCNLSTSEFFYTSSSILVHTTFINQLCLYFTSFLINFLLVVARGINNYMIHTLNVHVFPLVLCLSLDLLLFLQ